jgi:hypothetical protein
LERLVVTFGAGLDDRGRAQWVEALRNWHDIVSNDDYWFDNLSLEELGSFEPTILPSEIEEMRGRAVELAAEPLVVAARAALASNDSASVSAIMSVLEDLGDTGEWAGIASGILHLLLWSE